MRLFVAVNFPAAVRRKLSGLTAELDATSAPIRWTPPDNFHLTLRWLGERDAGERDRAADAVAEAAAHAEPFDVGFGPLGAFPSPRRPRVIWIAVEAGPRLRLLRDELERRLAAAGFARDGRSFRPHVTLGRSRRGAAPGAFRAFVALSGNLGLEEAVSVSAIELMCSRSGAGGASYESLARATLGTGGLPADTPPG